MDTRRQGIRRPARAGRLVAVGSMQAAALIGGVNAQTAPLPDAALQAPPARTLDLGNARLHFVEQGHKAQRWCSCTAQAATGAPGTPCARPWPRGTASCVVEPRYHWMNDASGGGKAYTVPSRRAT